MKSLQLAGMTIALALTAVAPAAAQNTTVFRQQPASGSGHRATSATPQAQPAPAYPAYPTYPGTPLNPRYPVAYTVLPAIIMSDGSIYANLGYGYVPVQRSCVAQYQQPRVLNGSDLLWNGGNPLTTTQPAPAQLTQSQLNLRAGRTVTTQAQRPANACYRMDPYGPVVVVY